MVLKWKLYGWPFFDQLLIAIYPNLLLFMYQQMWNPLDTNISMLWKVPFSVLSLSFTRGVKNKPGVFKIRTNFNYLLFWHNLLPHLNTYPSVKLMSEKFWHKKKRLVSMLEPSLKCLHHSVSYCSWAFQQNTAFEVFCRYLGFTSLFTRNFITTHYSLQTLLFAIFINDLWTGPQLVSPSKGHTSHLLL